MGEVERSLAPTSRQVPFLAVKCLLQDPASYLFHQYPGCLARKWNDFNK